MNDALTIHEVRRTLDNDYLKLEEMYAHILSNSNMLDTFDIKELKQVVESLRKVCTTKWTTEYMQLSIKGFIRKGIKYETY